MNSYDFQFNNIRENGYYERHVNKNYRHTVKHLSDVSQLEKKLYFSNPQGIHMILVALWRLMAWLMVQVDLIGGGNQT